MASVVSSEVAAQALYAPATRGSQGRDLVSWPSSVMVTTVEAFTVNSALV